MPICWSDNNDGTGNNLLGEIPMNFWLQLGGKGIPDGTYSVADFTSQV